MVVFYLNDLQQLRMLARVPIISAYDPSRESMLAYASPSNKIAIVTTGLVIDCLGTNNFLVTTSSLLKLTYLFIYLNIPQFIFTCSLLSCKPIQQHLQSTSSFILVLGKANIKHAQSCIGGRQNLREYLFYLQLLIGFDTLTYRKLLRSPILVVITFTDDLSRYGCIYLMKHKSETFENFKEFQSELENHRTR